MLKPTVCASHMMDVSIVFFRCFELLLVTLPYDVDLKHNIILSLFEAMFKSTESIESINA